MKRSVNKNLNILMGKKIAHRGLWNDKYPENSVGSFKRCIARGVPIELDVHVLKDNSLVVIHDPNTFRMTGKEIILKNAVYDDIKELKLKGTEYGIPKFSEVLELVDGKVLLDIEVKYDVKNFKICREISKLLDKYNGNFIIKSFNPIYVMWFRIFRPNYIRGLLMSVDEKKGKILNSLWHNFLIWLNLLMQCDFIAYDYKFLPNKKIDKLRKKGVPILIYTLKENEIINYKYDGYIYEE